MKNVILTTEAGEAVVVTNVPDWLFEYAAYTRAGGQRMPVEQWLAERGYHAELAAIEAERRG